jgi:hypothetical protein
LSRDQLDEASLNALIFSQTVGAVTPELVQALERQFYFSQDAAKGAAHILLGIEEELPVRPGPLVVPSDLGSGTSQFGSQASDWSNAVVGFIALGLIIGLVWIGFSWLLGGSGGGGGESCRAQFESCLNRQPESRWENYCQPRYYSCLDR